jgi:hypothetical protein
MAASKPLCEQSPGRATGDASLLALAARGCPAMLATAAPPHNSLRALRALRSNRCGESELVARCARRPRLLRFSAAQRRAAGRLPGALRGPPRTAGLASPRLPEQWAARRVGDFWVGEKRSAKGGARSAHPHLTRRVCSSAAPAGRVTSYAARPWCEHRSGVGLQGRPTQHEPSRGAARCDAPMLECRLNPWCQARPRINPPVQRQRS